jgi:hypothetical protein
MNQQISDLQVTTTKHWAGATSATHLGNVYGEAPHKISNVMSRVMGIYAYQGLDSIITLMGGVETAPDDRDVEWDLKGDDEKAVKIVSFSAGDQTKPGIGVSTFELVLEERLFKNTDVLNLDIRDIQIRIVAEPVMNGQYPVYTVEPVSGDPLAFIDPDLLIAGKQVAKEYSLVEDELAKNRGSVQYSSSFKLRNHFTTVGKEDMVSSKSLGRQMVISMTAPGKENKTTKIWTQAADWTFMQQYYAEKNRVMFYGKNNKTSQGTFLNKGDSGFSVKSMPGLRDQISPSYKFEYTTFSIDYLQEILTTLGYNILPEDKREFILLTGEHGMIQFSKAVEDKLNSYPSTYDATRISGSGQNRGFGGQYRSYEFPQGYTVRVVHLPEYDDTTRNRSYTASGKLEESLRYTILNFGTHKGKKNIRKIVPENEPEAMWYIAGKSSPYATKQSGNTMKEASSRVSGYEIMAECKFTVVVENPMSCAELIYKSR